MKRKYTRGASSQRGAAARQPLLDQLLGDQACGSEPHGGQDAQQGCEGTEGRTLVHGVDEFSGRAPEDSTPPRAFLPHAINGRRGGRSGWAVTALSLDEYGACVSLVAVEATEAGERREERDQSGQRQKSLHLHCVHLL